MSEKYYVVSESELNRLIGAWAFTTPGPHKLIATAQASSACRARPLDPEHMPEHMFKALLHVKGYSLKQY